MHTPLSQETAWKVVEAYIRQYGVVRHQIEAYDNFVQNLLPHIVDETQDIVIRDDENDEVHTISVCNMSIARPSNTEKDGVEHKLMPHLARLRGVSYECHVVVDVVHDISKNDVRVERRVFRETVLCSLPCMVGSSCCHTRYNTVNECRLDQGGYFVVNGVEKALIAQERLRTNYPFVFRLKAHPRFSLQCEIRSCHERKLRSTSTLYIYLTNAKRSELPDIVVELPFLNTRVSTVTLFRLLGMESKEDMISIVTGNTLGTTWSRLLRDIIDRDTIVDSTFSDLIERLGREATNEPTRERRQRYLEHICTNEILPHMGLTNSPDVHAKKRAFVAIMIRKLLRVHCDELQPDDRDHYLGKRVDPSGMGLLFRQVYRSHIKGITVQLFRLRDAGKLRATNVCQLFVHRRITNAFRYAFATGNWGINSPRASPSSAQTGVVQMISRMTVVSSLSNMRRINTPVSREGKAPKPRMLHYTSWGIVCPVETPEGGSCGLVKNLAMMAHCRVGTYSDAVLEAMVPMMGHTITPLLDVSDDQRGTEFAVFTNGILVGYTPTVESAHQIMNTMREMRRQNVIPFDTSVGMVDMMIHVDTDAGGLMRPLLVGEHLHKIAPLVEGGTYGDRSLWEVLLREGAVVYVDKQEELGLRVGLWCSEPDHDKYTHYEMHPSMINGLCASLIPFPDRNQAPRNTYQSAMCKQAVGVFAFNHGRRMDTVSHILCQPQKPLVSTRMERILNLTDAPSGVNVIVAIMIRKGYNQEDSVVLNQSAIDRGLFRTEKYTTTRDEERPNGGDNEKIENPQQSTDNDCCGMRVCNYDKIQKSGIPRVGTVLQSGDVIIGKTIKTSNIDANTRNVKKVCKRDKSILHRNETSTVDSVFTSTKVDGTRTVKVKTRTTRAPMVGDKLSSRMGQKGIIGRTFRQEDMPYTKDGIVPDVCVNPHAIPSRMTVGQIMECLVGKLASRTGKPVDATPFSKLTIEDIGDALEAEGLDRMGEEIMYNGETGETFEAAVFIGPTYYQRLKHMVVDKNHSRSRGPKQMLTRQPLEGRSRDGGLRFGEMERDCILSHGSHHMLLERLMLTSDVFAVWLCRTCGNFAIPPSSASLVRNTKAYCRNCENSRSVVKTYIPYACKLLIQELSAMHIGMQLCIDS